MRITHLQWDNNPSFSFQLCDIENLVIVFNVAKLIKFTLKKIISKSSKFSSQKRKKVVKIFIAQHTQMFNVFV